MYTRLSGMEPIIPTLNKMILSDLPERCALYFFGSPTINYMEYYRTETPSSNRDIQFERPSVCRAKNGSATATKKTGNNVHKNGFPQTPLCKINTLRNTHFIAFQAAQLGNMMSYLNKPISDNSKFHQTIRRIHNTLFNRPWLPSKQLLRLRVIDALNNPKLGKNTAKARTK